MATARRVARLSGGELGGKGKLGGEGDGKSEGEGKGDGVMARARVRVGEAACSL